MAVAIRFDEVSKRYRLGSRFGELREFVPDPISLLRDWWRRRDGGPRRDQPPGGESRELWALRDVSFEVEQGEALGIIGPNGAGKSTILKLLAGTTEPFRGRVETHGRVAALIEIGAGFHPDLTGRENVFLNGAILGLGKREIQAKFDSIVGFAELERFIDTPVKRYSSGMYMRLGYAVAAHLDPDVLLVDEVLAVGDAAFRRKCLEHMQGLLSSGRTVVLVTHSLAALGDLCPRTIVMAQGQKRFDGKTEEAIKLYFESVQASYRRSRTHADVLGRAILSGDAEVVRVAITDEQGREVTQVRSGDRGEIRVQVRFHARLRNPSFGCIIRRSDGVVASDVGSAGLGIATGDFAAGEEVEVAFRNRWSLGNGTYYVTVYVTDQQRRVRCDCKEAAAALVVSSRNVVSSVADLDTVVEVRRPPGADADVTQGDYEGPCEDVRPSQSAVGGQ